MSVIVTRYTPVETRVVATLQLEMPGWYTRSLGAAARASALVIVTVIRWRRAGVPSLATTRNASARTLDPLRGGEVAVGGAHDRGVDAAGHERARVVAPVPAERLRPRPQRLVRP